eukprot:CAMPEP_0117527534 /NCGR_PEP_ID=MMETSP0784-20121206/36849_1 /TAXON_ID=39447 /ORGANISM="" /LENGTH=60 /DNA_ID=CAMNT_0005323793 /DNA_START=108 /DNA_END=290 /DNA_ORIENTATION=+
MANPDTDDIIPHTNIGRTDIQESNAVCGECKSIYAGTATKTAMALACISSLTTAVTTIHR